MTNEKLKLNFPIGGGDVFDINNNEPLFAYANAFSNTTSNIDNLSFEQFEINIPVGYKTILLCSRVKLIDLGTCVREFDFNENGKFILLTNSNYNLYVASWKREIETTTIYKPNHLDLSLESSIWDSIDECFQYGLEYSKINNCKVLIASVLDTINWH